MEPFLFEVFLQLKVCVLQFSQHHLSLFGCLFFFVEQLLELVLVLLSRSCFIHPFGLFLVQGLAVSVVQEALLLCTKLLDFLELFNSSIFVDKELVLGNEAKLFEVVSVLLLRFLLSEPLLLNLSQLLFLDPLVAFICSFSKVFLLVMESLEVGLNFLVPLIVTWNELSGWIKMVNQSLDSASSN